MRALRLLTIAFFASLAVVACGDDGGTFVDAGASDTGRGGRGGGGGADSGRGGGLDDTGVRDTGADAGGTDGGTDGGGDAGADSGGEDTGIPPGCDQDGDGDPADTPECGGTDCDDDDRLRSGLIGEQCDAIDNNCDGIVNDGITCEFYAHTATELYLIDPFAPNARQVGDVPEDLWDIDTHPDGTLYGVTSGALWKLNTELDRWERVGNFSGVSGDPNGFSIDLDGIAYITSGNTLYTVSLRNARLTELGRMGNDGGRAYESSGDCVVNKDNSLFVSSRHTETDSLVLLDSRSGEGTQIGETGYTSVFALTAAWGQLYGMTSSGELITISQSDGSGDLVTDFGEQRWYGAASTPDR